MVKLLFKEPLLEKLYRRFKWARNNTLLLLEAAEKQSILDFVPQRTKSDSYTIQNTMFQFQCLLTTSDAYFRKISNNPNTSFGILLKNGNELKKEDLDLETIKTGLIDQLPEFEKLLQPFNSAQLDQHLGSIQTLANHEHMHHGELILMFRLAGAELPKRFQTAWAL